MSDDVLMQLSSNSNPSDRSKLAKLEARMVGKSSSSPSVQSSWQVPSSVKFGTEELPDSLSSSDSEDDNGREFLIQANTQKRKRAIEDDHIMPLQLYEVYANERLKFVVEESAHNFD